MNIPNMPIGELLERDSSGNFTGNMSASWQFFLRGLVQALQANLSNNGYILPQLPTVTLNQINVAGNLIYDSITKTAKINLDGVTYKTIQTA